MDQALKMRMLGMGLDCENQNFEVFQGRNLNLSNLKIKMPIWLNLSKINQN